MDPQGTTATVIEPGSSLTSAGAATGTGAGGATGPGAGGANCGGVGAAAVATVPVGTGAGAGIVGGGGTGRPEIGMRSTARSARGFDSRCTTVSTGTYPSA